MDRISILQKEIDELRKTLNMKEDELYALKRTWNSATEDRSKMVNQTYSNTTNYLYELSSVTHTKEDSNNGATLPKWAIERYSRQIILSDIGVEGQKKLCAARVLVVGAGGLGCPAAAYLAGAGVGEIGIVDYDTVEVTNLHRQILHGECDQRMNKVESAANALRRINSSITVTPYNVQLQSSNALELLSRYHIVLDCTDNVPTRYLLNDACVMLKIPLVSGSALKMEGQLTVYGYRGETNSNEEEGGGGARGPCYRCVFPSPPPPAAVGSCSAHGVAGPVCGAVGCLQALQAVKWAVGGRRGLLAGRLLLIDGDDCTFRTVKLRPRNPECASCSDHPTVTRLLDYETFCRTKAIEKRKQEAHLKSQRRREEKEKRMTGQSYFGFRRAKIVNSKEKWVQDVPKSERRIGPACTSDFCAKGVARQCTVFSQEKRQEIFQRFWNEYDWSEKRNYVKRLVDNIPPKRRRLKHKGEISRKGDSKQYHLMHNDDRLPVCRTMFLNTLGIKEAMVRCWLTATDNEPKTTKKRPIKSLNVSSYLDSLPKAPPKCDVCRGSLTILYLDCDVRNLHQLYNRYVNDMKMAGVVPASRKTFSKVFATKDVSIFKPKNDGDICDLIVQHNPSLNDFHNYQSIEVSDNIGNVDIQTYHQW